MYCRFTVLEVPFWDVVVLCSPIIPVTMSYRMISWNATYMYLSSLVWWRWTIVNLASSHLTQSKHKSLHLIAWLPSEAVSSSLGGDKIAFLFLDERSTTVSCYTHHCCRKSSRQVYDVCEELPCAKCGNECWDGNHLIKETMHLWTNWAQNLILRLISCGFFKQNIA